VQNEWVRLDELAREAADLFSIVAEEKGLQLRLPSDLPPLLVCTDKRHLQRIYSNLLDNALKFTPSGEISLGLVQREGQVGLFVQDSGPGLNTEQQSRVFQKFFRADPSRSKAGFGLGLAYCQAACSMLDAKLNLECRAGEGCRFEVLFQDLNAAKAAP
jgi:signal transduction histidine kinase